MGLKSTYHLLKIILEDPLNKDFKYNALYRFFYWQVTDKLFNKPLIFTLTNKSKLIAKKNHKSAISNYYFGLYEFNDMAFTLHFLRNSDSFVDIGANIGSYTILASAHVGASTIAFEPNPQTFNSFKKNILLNRIESKCEIYQMALGAKKTEVKFTHDSDTTNHVATAKETKTINIQLDTLDEMLANHQVPRLIKIDVEGFESEVIAGAKLTLANEQLQAVIIELNGLGSKRYGTHEELVHLSLLQNQFKPYSYNPASRTLSPMNTFNNKNTIYIRNLKFVEERLRTAESFIVNKQIF